MKTWLPMVILPITLLCSGCSGFGGDRRISCKIGVPGIFEVEWSSSVDGSYTPLTEDSCKAESEVTTE